MQSTISIYLRWLTSRRAPPGTRGWRRRGQAFAICQPTARREKIQLLAEAKELNVNFYMGGGGGRNMTIGGSGGEKKKKCCQKMVMKV